MSDYERRWRGGYGSLALVMGLVGLAACLGPPLRPRAAARGDGVAALLVLEGVPGTTVRRLLRVEFRGTEVRPPEMIWEGEADFFDGPDRSRVVDDRYVVTPRGGVIDVWERDVVQPPGRELLDVVGGRVVTRPHDPRCPDDGHALDLRTRAVEPLTGTDRERYARPGLRSADGTKAVETVGSELIVHRPGRPPRSVGSFLAQACPVSGRPVSPPVLWLDDDRLLTQDGNGRLVTVSLDGVRAPVVTVPVQPHPVEAPHLIRLADGRILYACGPEAFVIHPTARTWERPDWVGLGYGFEASWEEGESSEHTVRHRGRPIGRCRCWPGGTVAAEGFLAVATASAGAAGWDAVRVWSAGTGAWSTAALRPLVLVGWAR